MDQEALPSPTSPEFPGALKSIREAKGWSRSKLASEAGIHGVMPRRYEEPDSAEFAVPSEATYKKLCRALGFAVVGDDDIVLRKASLEEIVAELHDRGIGVSLNFPAPTTKL